MSVSKELNDCDFASEYEQSVIRGKVNGRSGVFYEMILEDRSPNVSLPNLLPSSNRNASFEDILGKLEAAEIRRQSLEHQRVSNLSQSLAKVEQASRRRLSLNLEFIYNTKQQLETSMEQHIEKRGALQAELCERLKFHSDQVLKIREQLREQAELDKQAKQAIERKLQQAETLRKGKLLKMQQKLHNYNVERIRDIKRRHAQALASQSKTKALLIACKLQQAAIKREHELQKKVLKARLLMRQPNKETMSCARIAAVVNKINNHTI